MNTLHVIPAIAPRYGGPSYAILALAKALIDRNVDVVIATTDADGEGRLPVPCNILSEQDGIPIRYFPRQISEAFKYSRPLARWLRQHVDRFDLVHIHAIFSHSSVAAYKACLAKGIPYIVRPLGTLDPATIRHKAMRKRLFGLAWGRQMLSLAAAIHYTTEREKELVEASLGLTDGYVAPIGIDLPSREPKPGTMATHLPGQDFTRPYVIFLGRLDPIKNIELMIDAFSLVTREKDLGHWNLVIAGDGPSDYRMTLETRARRTTAADRIKFVGWQTGAHKTNALNDADLLALPSRHENLGRSALEAMAFGVPVVVSEDVFVADQIRRYQAGWVAAGNLAGFVRILRDALVDTDERRLRGARAKRLVAEHLDINACADRITALYDSIAAPCRRPNSQFP